MAKSATIQAERREEARRKLVGYRALCDIYEKLLAIAEAAESRLFNVTAQYEEMRVSSTAKEKMGEQLGQLEEQTERLAALCAEMAERLDVSVYLVNAVVEADPKAATVLSKRYLDPRREPSFAEIAEEMGYSEDRVKHMHLDGLDIASEVLEKLALFST